MEIENKLSSLAGQAYDRILCIALLVVVLFSLIYVGANYVYDIAGIKSAEVFSSYVKSNPECLDTIYINTDAIQVDKGLIDIVYPEFFASFTEVDADDVDSLDHIVKMATIRQITDYYVRECTAHTKSNNLLRLLIMIIISTYGVTGYTLRVIGRTRSSCIWLCFAMSIVITEIVISKWISIDYITHINTYTVLVGINLPIIVWLLYTSIKEARVLIIEHNSLLELAESEVATSFVDEDIDVTSPMESEGGETETEE